MRVVLIAWCYPPDKLVGSLRAARLARALRDAGVEVDVVTSRLPEEESISRPSDPGIRVNVVRPLPTPAEAYRWLKRLLARSPALARSATPPAAAPARSSEKPGDSSEALTPRRDPLWKRTILSLIAVPDNRHGFILPAFARALSLARGADLIYTTSPPHSDHVVGWMLKRMTGVRWVAEFRDPWTGGAQSLSRVQTRASKAIDSWLERRCLESADVLVGVSEGICELLRRRVGREREQQVILAMNGIDQVQPALRERKGGPFRILYVGDMYLGRDPRPFLSALAAVRERAGFGPDELRVDLVGQCSRFHDVSVEDYAAERGLSDVVHFTGWVPHARSRELQEEADLLLLLAQRQPIQIPNKLFEYLGTRKPILAFVDAEGESAAILQRVGGHYLVFGHEPAHVEERLSAALDADSVSREVPDASVLEELRADRQMAHLLGALGVPSRRDRTSVVAGRRSLTG